MTDKKRSDERPTEDAAARKDLGPRGIPGKPDQKRLTRQEAEQMPKSGDFDGHTA